MKEIDINELISAYYDNELTEIELDYLLEETKRNPQLLAKLNNYALITAISEKDVKVISFFERVSDFAQKIFRNFDLCLAGSEETKNNLIKLNAKNIKYISLNLRASALYNGVGALTPNQPRIRKPITNTKRLILNNILLYLIDLIGLVSIHGIKNKTTIDNAIANAPYAGSGIALRIE